MSNDKIIVRHLNPDDVREHDKVSSQAFVYSCDIDDKASVLPSEIMLGAFLPDNKTLMADMEIGDKLCNFGNSTLRCAAVGGVAAKPEYRGRGAVKALFAELFNEAWDISILYPFSDAYYRRLGYETVGRALKIKLPFKSLIGIERNSCAKLYEGENKKQLLDIYNAYARKNNLCFLRDELMLCSDNPYESCQYTYYLDNAYITFVTSRDDLTVYVKELIYLDASSFKKILGFLKNFEGNYDTIVFEKLPINTPILNYIADSKNAEINQYSVGAARIINAENVLKANKYPNADGRFVVEIKNDGIYDVSFKNGTANVIKNSTAEVEISMDVATASRVILSGISSESEAEYLNGMEIHTKNSDFFRAFLPKDAFFTDEF